MKPNILTDDIRRDFLNWCKYHYVGNLVGLAFFDPSSADAAYPCSDINALIIVHMAPEEARERYEMVAQLMVQDIAAHKSIACRVQTAGELSMLAELQLPLLKIYLSDAEIVYDPAQVLASAKEKLLNT